jgi:hypothetical protein
MASRIFWVLVSGIALITGMVLQDGDRIFAWADDTDITASTERAINARVERAVERSVDKMQVVGPDGREIDVPAETKRALGDAVGRLVKAEADLVILKVHDGSSEEIQAASIRRDQARTDVETLRAQIEQQDRASERGRDVVGEQIQRKVREDVRTAIRDAVSD